MPAENCRHPPYKYLTLAEVAGSTEHNTYPSVYGVISDWGHPNKTRGADMMMTVTLVDPTSVDPANEHMFAGMRSTTLQVFAPSREHFPKIRCTGDVIRVHRASTGLWQDKMQLRITLGKPSIPVTFALFDGRDPAGRSYHFSTANYHDDDGEREKRTHLANWWKRAFPEGVFTTAYSMSIDQLPSKEYFDLHCMVVHVDTRVADDVVMYVWDGTDARPLPPDASNYHMEHMRKDDDFPQSRAKYRCVPRAALEAPGLRRLGTFFPVLVSSKTHELPAVGEWVKLRNLGMWIYRSQMQGLFHDRSRWAHTAPGASIEDAYRRRLEGGQVSTWLPGAGASGHIVTRNIKHGEVPLSTIRDVLAHPEAVGKFRCLCKVVGYTPEAAEEWCHPLASLGGMWAQVAGAEEFTYTVELMLEDSTGSLQALLWKDEAARFFHGNPPTDLRTNPATKESVQRLMDKLLGGEVGRDPTGVWASVCLKSYCEDPERPLDTRRYQVFDTTFVGL